MPRLFQKKDEKYRLVVDASTIKRSTEMFIEGIDGFRSVGRYIYNPVTSKLRQLDDDSDDDSDEEPQVRFNKSGKKSVKKSGKKSVKKSGKKSGKKRGKKRS